MAVYDKVCGFCYRMDLNKDDGHGRYWCDLKRDFFYACDMPSMCTLANENNFYHTAYRNFDEARRAVAYSKRCKGCYIATVVAQILGLDENCQELVTLRNFKAIVLTNSEYRDRLIKYDNLGLLLAERLLKDENKVAIAQDLYGYINYCAKKINCGEIEQALTQYKEMIELLSSHYQATYVVGESAYENYENRYCLQPMRKD